MKNFYCKFFRNTLTTVLTVVISCLAIILVAYGATTISSNISTGGTLSVTGLSTFATATSTSATSSAYMFVGVPFSHDANMDFAGGDLFVTDALNVGGVTYLDGALQATSTSLFTGAAKFYSTVNVTGLLTMTRATSTSATSTDYVYIGADNTEPTGWDFANGDLFVTDDAYFNSQATSSVSLWVGNAGTANNINLQGGDLYVQNDAEIDGTLYGATVTFSGLITAAGGIDTAGATTDITLKNDETITNATDGNIAFSGTAMSMATTTATTTPGIWVAAPGGNTTSTVAVGHGGATYGNLAGCIELWREGSPYKIYINTTGDGLVVAAGRCKDI